MSGNVVSASAIAIDEAARLLAGGELVAFPTETVYGLGADATNDEAVRRIFAVKGRPADHPVIVHIANRNDLGKWARAVSKGAAQLAEAFWPGPLALILPRARPNCVSIARKASLSSATTARQSCAAKLKKARCISALFRPMPTKSCRRPSRTNLLHPTQR